MLSIDDSKKKAKSPAVHRSSFFNIVSSKQRISLIFNPFRKQKTFMSESKAGLQEESSDKKEKSSSSSIVASKDSDFSEKMRFYKK